MAGNRKAAEAQLIADLLELQPNGISATIYRDTVFPSMSDEEFDELVKSFEEAGMRPCITNPVLCENGLNVENNFRVAEKWGHDFYQRIWMDPGEGIPRYLTNKAYLVFELPWRRQAQLQEKKVRIPKHNRSIDDLTGQPSGDSKGSKISSPEVQVLAALGMEQSLLEMMKYRGGDVKGFDAMCSAIDKNGSVSLKSIEHLAGGVESTKSLSAILTSMHISNTLTG